MVDAYRVAQIIHIADPEVDLQGVAQQLATNLAQHNFVAPDAFPKFEVRPPAHSEHTLADPLAFNLRQAAQSLDEVWVQNEASPQGLPLLTHLRRAAHTLVVYYVNRLAARQMCFNAAILRVLFHFVNTPRFVDEIEMLRNEVTALRERIDVLECQPDEVQ